MQDMRLLTILFFLFNCIQGVSQGKLCGFKNNCECDENKTLENSFSSSNFIIVGEVLDINNLSLYSILTPASIKQINSNNEMEDSCAKESLNKDSVQVVLLRLVSSYKGSFENENIGIVTPVLKSQCGYKEFKKGVNYLISGTVNTTADIYFTWSLKEDAMELKPNYQYWTNTCKHTLPLNKKLKAQLKAITNQE